MRALSIDPRMQRLGFDLRGIPGLEAAWLSRFPSGLGTMALPADGTPMGTWVDLSGKGRDLMETVNKPLWKPNGGIPGMEFTSTTRLKSDTNFVRDDLDLTIYLCITFMSPIVTASRVGIDDGSTGNTRHRTDVTSGASTLRYVRGTASLKSANAPSPIVPDTAELYTLRTSGTSFSVARNGVFGDANTYDPQPEQTIPLRLITSSNSALYHDLIICSQAHDDTTRKRIEAWLARKNGVTLT